MRRNVILSLLFHATVIFVAVVGLPDLSRRELNLDSPITVDIVNVAPVTNAPAPAPPKPEPKPEPPKAAPPPPPKPQAAPPPPPPPPPPKPQAEPAPAPVPKPTPAKEKPKEEARPPEPRLAKVQPKRKPPPPDDMASVLKTLEEPKQRPLKPDETVKDRKRTPPPEEKFDVAEIQKALSQRPRPHDPSKALSISEIDLVRRQIEQCWNLPAGAKDAHKMTVEVRVVMNVDGTVREAALQEPARTLTDPFYRAMAESVIRAVLNPKCQPFKLPPDRYDVWQTMLLNFDPRGIL
jgi:outer membrane biosynthesis protein TonB